MLAKKVIALKTIKTFSWKMGFSILCQMAQYQSLISMHIGYLLSVAPVPMLVETVLVTLAGNEF